MRVTFARLAVAGGGVLAAIGIGVLVSFAAPAGVAVVAAAVAGAIGQAAAGVRNRSHAAALAASRDRIVRGQDAERRRIQALLHDGVQQEIVALSARTELVRRKLMRGDPAAAALADIQQGLTAALHDVREIAYAIHPPVLSDHGLLEAAEAQCSRLTVPMAVRADPGLRGVRFPEHIETTAWCVLAGALSNVVRHAGATEVEVSLHHQDGWLGLVISDDGCGFDSSAPRGPGLTGLADRLDTVGGTLTIDSGAGRGTSVRASIPAGRMAESPADPEQARA